MNDGNPYAPPMADVAERVIKVGTPWKGILYGALIDVGGSILVAIAVGIGFTFFLAANGVPSSQIAAVEQHPGLFLRVLEYAIGYSFSVLGGYVCARFIKEHELRWALVMAVITSIISLLLSSRHAGAEKYLLETLGEFACVVGGAWLGMRINRRQLARQG